MIIPETRCTQYIWYLHFHYYHWVPEGIIRPVISASALTWFVIIFINQAQASKQFLASIKLASNKAICLKTKKINKSNMYF
jgi:hypothetical protein